jgi:glutaminyl-tRNA synthetase
MPTLCGLRRRGVTPAAIRNFCEDVGVAKRENTIELAKLEAAVRDDLNRVAERAMGVLRPLRVVIENYPPGVVEEFQLANHPQDPSRGTRRVPFARELWIERDDFEEDPPPKYHRLAPGREVRLRGAYLVTCTGVQKDAAGRVSELRCRYDPETRGGDAPDGRKVKGTIHWVSARHALPAEVRLYETLFAVPDPNDVREGGDFTDGLRADSLERLTQCRLEPHLAGAKPGDCWQLERLGYFCVDSDSRPGQLVLNRTVTLRDTWGKLQQREG